MKAAIPLLLVLLLVPITDVTAQGIDPLSVVVGFWTAADTGSAEAAVTFWADDAVFTNSRGAKIIGRNAIRGVIQAAINAGLHLGPIINPQVTGDTVKWTTMERTDFWVRLGIAPVEIKTQGVVQNGKIKSISNYYPPTSLVRIQRACENPQAQGVLLFGGQSCSDFLQRAKAYTRSIAANLKPFSAETDFMSLQGYLSPLTR